MDYISKSHRKSPKDTASVVSKFCSYWIFMVLKESYHRVIDINDIWQLPKKYQSDEYIDALQKTWEHEVSKEVISDKKRKPSLLKVLMKVYGRKYLLILVEAIVCQIPNLLRPMFVAGLLLYFNGVGDQITGVWYMFGLIVTMCLYIFTLRNKSSKALTLGIIIQRDIIMLVYKKSVKLSATSISEVTPGQIVNIVSNDVNRIPNMIDTGTNLATAPIVMIVITIYVYFSLGIPAFAGLIAVVLIIPVQYVLCRMAKRYRLKVARQTDQRVKLMNEIIHGIQVIKMYAWEKPFIKVITEIRKKELRYVRIAVVIRSIYMLILTLFSRLYLYIILITYVISGNYITSYLVFTTSICSYIISNTGVSATFKTLVDFGEIVTSIKRLENFLILDEYNVNTNSISKINNVKSGKINKPLVKFNNVFAKWSATAETYTLSKINLSIKKNEIVGIFGSVGSGKSSLLETVLGELSIQSGQIFVDGILSYASQDAWIFPASVRQNIVFGQEYDTVKYNNVIRACSLVYDLQKFRYGDQTLVGENGALLSGGQRARINLARAIYKEADIYLLDDPLSAVDAHVGNNIFQNCIKGYIKDKTCLIATHQLQFIHLMDKIIIMDKGKIEFFGTYEELQRSDVDFQSVLENSDPENEIQSDKVSYHVDDSDIPIENQIDRELAVASVMTKNGRSKSICSYKEGTDVNNDFASQEETKEEINSIGNKIFWLYAKSGTSVLVITLIALFYVYSQVTVTGIELFLSTWIKNEKKILNSIHYEISPVPITNSTFEMAIHDDPIVLDELFNLNLLYIYIYTGAIVNAIILMAIKMPIMSIITINASKVMQNSVLRSVLNAPYVFFTENNSGRLLNRFSIDLGDLDESLPNCILDYVQICSEIAGGLILICIINPKAAILVLLVVMCLYFVQKHFVLAFKNLRDAEGMSRSPVLSYLNSTLQGLNTIHCTEITPMLEQQFKNHLDLNTSSKYIISEATCAFVVLINAVMLTFYLSIMLIFFFFDYENGVGAGIAIANLMRVITIAEIGLKLCMDIWYKVISFERLSYYKNLESEKQPSLEDAQKVSSDWPAEGKIEFVNVHLRYKTNQPAVLKGVNITMKPKEKIGIVGRTGAGKSSIVNALFRLAQIDGAIKLDGVDTAAIRLETLRSKLSIIPQSPTLFSGTLRLNLDPFSEKQDYELINALSEVGIFEKLVPLNGLEMIVTEGGNNFSVGERQLICLARAIIKQNRILIMDEATANIDSKTDRQIQTVIKRKFEHCTVLTIAHRLHTVMHSDKILVMNGGVVEEYGCPYELLNQADSKLRKLVEETGPETSKYLKQEAKKMYFKTCSA